MPVAWCLATPTLGEREAAETLLDRATRQGVLRPGMVVLADKGLAGRGFDQFAADLDALLARPDRTNEPYRFGSLGGVRQWIEAIFDLSKTSSAWSATAPTPSRASGSGSPSGCSPGHRSLAQLAAWPSGPWSPTTTDTTRQSTSVI
jgi:hypothetical protein